MNLPPRILLAAKPRISSGRTFAKRHVLEGEVLVKHPCTQRSTVYKLDESVKNLVHVQLGKMKPIAVKDSSKGPSVSTPRVLDDSGCVQTPCAVFYTGGTYRLLGALSGDELAALFAMKDDIQRALIATKSEGTELKYKKLLYESRNFPFVV